LNATERAHVLRLALGSTGRVFKRETVPAHIAALVDQLSTPAYVIGARCDLLCWNAAAVALFRDFSKVPVARRNTLLQMFTSPEVRSRYPEWEQEARNALESFRVTYDFWSHSPEFNALVDELNAESPEFARWWKAHEIRPKPSGAKVMTRPTLGRVKLGYSTLGPMTTVMTGNVTNWFAETLAPLTPEGARKRRLLGLVIVSFVSGCLIGGLGVAHGGFGVLAIPTVVILFARSQVVDRPAPSRPG
jgi:hypothetical protein